MKGSLRLTIALLSICIFTLLSSASDGSLSKTRMVSVIADGTNTKQAGRSAAIGTCDFGNNIDVEATGGVNAGYASLQAAFAAINGGVHTGAINVEICTSEIEPAGSAVLDSSGAGSASYTSINVYPIVDGVTVSGTPVGGRGLIELKGADNVTIDGDNPNTGGVNRNLSLTNTASPTTTLCSVIRIANPATAGSGSDNLTLRNMILNGNVTAGNALSIIGTSTASNASFGVYVGGNGGTTATDSPTPITSVTSQPIAASTTVNNLIIDNNAISQTARAIEFNGIQTTQSTAVAISNNVIGNPVAGAATGVYSMGITVQGTLNAAIKGNALYVESYLAAAIRAIDIGSISANVSGVIIEQNKVLRVQNNNPTGNGAYGINLAANSGQVVRNNFTSGVLNTPGTSGTFSITTGAFGIRVAGGSGHSIYHNSVNMSGDLSGAAAGLSAAIGVTSGSSTGIDARNNVFANIQTQSAAASPSSSALVAIFLPSSVGPSMDLTLNNNNYYIGASQAAYNGYGQAGTFSGINFFSTFNPSQTTPASNLRSYTTQLNVAGTNDNASNVSNPSFISNADLHISGSSSMINAGANVGVTSDIDGQARPYGAAPDIGADEIVPSAAGASISGRVVTAYGQGIRNVIVKVDGGSLTQPVYCLTGGFGYYRFDDLPAGQTYVLSVSAKRFTFADPTRAVNLDDELLNFDFVSEP